MRRSRNLLFLTNFQPLHIKIDHLAEFHVKCSLLKCFYWNLFDQLSSIFIKRNLSDKTSQSSKLPHSCFTVHEAKTSPRVLAYSKRYKVLPVCSPKFMLFCSTVFISVKEVSTCHVSPLSFSIVCRLQWKTLKLKLQVQWWVQRMK